MARTRYDDFHESLAAPTGRDVAVYWPVTNVISAIAGILDTLLLVRFVIHLITNDTSLGLVSIMNALTNWMVAPFNGVLGIATGTTGTGYVDWSALVAVVIISLIAGIIMRITRAAEV